MSPEGPMASLLAKIRRRAISLGSQNVLDPSSITVPDQLHQPPAATIDLLQRQVTESRIDRRIRPDINSMLDRYSLDNAGNKPGKSLEAAAPLKGLSPSSHSKRRRHSIDSSALIRESLRTLTSEVQDIEELTRDLSATVFPATSVDWSTFGRNDAVARRDRAPIPVPRPSTSSGPSTKSSKPKSNVGQSGSTRSESIYAAPSTHDSSPAATTSSHRAQFRAEIPWAQVVYTSTPRTVSSRSRRSRERSEVSSPHTFGRVPSVPEFGAFSTPRRSQWYDETPPLPPLDHHAFSQQQPPARGSSWNPDSSPPSAFTSNHKHFTFKQEENSSHDNDIQRFQQQRAFHSVPSFPFSIAPTPDHSRSNSRNKRRRNSQSRSRASLPARIKRTSSTPTKPQLYAANTSIARRAVTSIRDMSIDISRRLSVGGSSGTTNEASTRRSSAEWSARQAALLGETGGGYGESWPQQVSRQILEMSGVVLGLGSGTPALAGRCHDNSRMSSKLLDIDFLNSREIPSRSVSNPDSIQRGRRVVRAVSSVSMNGSSAPSNVLPSEKGKGKSVPTKPARTPSPSPPKAMKSIERTLADSNTGTPMRTASQENTVRWVTPKGKRKADETDYDSSPDGTPPDKRKEMSSSSSAGQKTTSFAADVKDKHRPGSLSRPPSSYRRKRARLSGGLLDTFSSQEGETLNAQNTGSLPRPPSRATSQVASTRSITHTQQSSINAPQNLNRPSSRRSARSMSQSSIPISALLSPHAPSVSRSATFHMRDPRRPPRKLAQTGWSLHFADPNEPGSGSPTHAWMFFIGFIIFPLWWFASFWRTPETRTLGSEGEEKAVVVDDPQVERDAKQWRFRCRVMAGVSLLTYVPFIVLVAIFAPRS